MPTGPRSTGRSRTGPDPAGRGLTGPGPAARQPVESAFDEPAFAESGSDGPRSEEPGHDGSESDSSGTGRPGSDQPGSDRPEFGGPGFREPGFGGPGFEGPRFGAPASGGRGSEGAEFESVGSGPTETPPAGQPFTAVTREPAAELRPGPRPIPADRAPRPTAGRVPPHRDLASAVRLVPPGEADAADPEPRSTGRTRRAPQPALAELPQRRRRDPANGTGPLERVGEPEPTGERRHRYLIERDPGVRIGPAADPGRERQHRALAHPGPARPAGDRSGRPVRPGPARAAPEPSTPGAAEGPAGAAGPAELGLRPESVARLSASGRELLARLQAELQGGPQLGPRPGGLSPNGNGTGPQARVDPPDLAG